MSQLDLTFRMIASLSWRNRTRLSLLLCSCVDRVFVYFLSRSSLPNSKFDLFLAVTSDSRHLEIVAATKTQTQAMMDQLAQAEANL